MFTQAFQKRNLACPLLLILLVVTCFIYVFNDRQVKPGIDRARFRKSATNSSGPTPIVQTFNYLPWASLGKQISPVTVNSVFSEATIITPFFEFEIDCSLLASGLSVPFVVLAGPSVFSVDNITNLGMGHFRLSFPGRMDSGTYEMHIIVYIDKTPYAIPGSPFGVTILDKKEESDRKDTL